MMCESAADATLEQISQEETAHPPMNPSAPTTDTAAALKDFEIPEVFEIAKAYLYGYPIVLLDQTRAAAVYQPNAAINVFEHVRDTPDDTFDTIVRPNVDTLYSSAFLDLSEGPVVLRIPPTDGRYQLVALFDAWTNNFAAASTLKEIDASKGATFVIAQRGHTSSLPHSFTERFIRFESPTPLVWMLIRTLVLGDDDLPKANAIQDSMTLAPLRAALPAPKSSNIQCPDPTIPPPKLVQSMRGVEFFSQLSKLLEEQGALLPGDLPMLRTLASIGVGPFATTTVDRLSLAQKAQLQLAVGLAQNTVKFIADAGPPPESGWSPEADVPIGDYGTEYVLRALLAFEGFGANRPDVAVYQNANTDANEESLSGEHVYTLTFAAGEQPPVEGFWSVTVYNSQLSLAKNDLGRYALGSTSGLVAECDGSIVLTLSHQEPECSPKANWLPIPAESFALTMRLYGPREAILNKEWTPPRPQRA